MNIRSARRVTASEFVALPTAAPFSSPSTYPVWLVRTVEALLAAAIVACAASVASGQSAAPTADWNHLSAIRAQTRIHIAADGGGKTCNFVSADDEKLICSAGRNESGKQFSFARAAVKRVRLSRRRTSAMDGALIGAGAGAIAAGIENYRDRNDFFRFPGVNFAIGTLGGAIAGAAIAGPADLFRGPTVYKRAQR